MCMGMWVGDLARRRRRRWSVTAGVLYIYIPAYTFIGLSLEWQRSEIEKRPEYHLLFGRRKGD